MKAPNYPSKREIEVLERLCEGLSNKEIASELYVSTHTIDSHRKNIMFKLNARSSVQLGVLAVSRGFISGSEQISLLQSKDQ